MAAHATHVAVLLGVLLLCGVSYGLVFTVIGDWGVPGLTYTPVIAARSTQRKSQFTVAIGDNFYKGGAIGGKSHGVVDINDPKWDIVFQKQFPYSNPFFRKTWYVIAGNHDYDGNEKAQVQYTTSAKNVGKRWHFPSLYYHFTKKVSRGVAAEFFMIDSQVLANDNSELAPYGRNVDLKQLKRIKNWLETSKATWKFMFSHHPIYHNKNKNEFLVKKLVPLLEKHKVAAFISGHMHNFQHMKSPKVHYITVGATAIQTPVEKGRTIKGVKELFVHPTEAQWPACGADLCKGFATVNVKDKRKTVLEYWNSKSQLLRKIEIINPKR